MSSSLPRHPSVTSRPILRSISGEIQPWKIYEMHVRDSFYTPNRSLKRTQSSAEIGPSILLQDVYPEDLTAAFGGRVQLKDEYEIKKRIPHSVGYLDRTFIDAKADIYPAQRFYDLVREPNFYEKSTDDYFHMYRPWRVHLPGTYSSTWQMRYEKGLKNNLSTTAALVNAKKRNHFTYILSGDYRTPTYWNARFGEKQTYAPYVKNPWYLDAAHYNRCYKGY